MTTSVSPETSPRTPFVGRERELGHLIRRLESARDGRGDFVAIHADAGLGKTRLCEEIADVARRQGFADLRGQCLEGDAGIPYLPFVELIEAAASALSGDDLRKVSAHSAPQLAVIAPQLAATLGAAPEDGGGVDYERQTIFTALRDFLDRASRLTPLLLVFEDVHWADEATGLLLRHLIRFSKSRRILVVVTCRRPAADGGAAAARTEQLLGDVRRLGDDGVVSLDELALPEVATMIATMAGREPPSRICEALFERTSGNPLFVEQAVRHLLEEGRLFDERGRWIELTSFDELPIPDSVRTLIGQRLERVRDQCRQMLAAAAIGGRRVEYDLLRDVVGLASDAFLVAVEEGERAQLITVEQRANSLSISFRHDLIRHAILVQVSLPRRRSLHLAFANAIERRYGGARGEHDIDLAHHYLQARSTDDARKTLQYVTAAAKRAVAAAAFEEAARLYAEGLQLVPESETEARCELLLLLGEARKRVSDSDVARSTFEEAAEIAQTIGNADQFARAALGYSRSWPTVSSVDERAIELLRGALGVVPDGDLLRRAQLQARYALQMLYCGSPSEVRALAEDAVDAARRSGDAVCIARALQGLHAALWQPEHLKTRLAAATEIIEVARTLGDEGVALWGLRPRIADLMELADMSAVEDDIDAYERTAIAGRVPIFLWQAAVRKAMLAIFRGHLDEGERLAQRALELGRQAEGQNLIAAFGGQLLVIRWLQGRAGELESLIKASRQNEPHVKLWAAVLAFIQSESGRHADARRLFEELAADRFASVPQEDTRLVVLVLASMVCAALGDGIRAEQLYELLSPYEGRNIVVSEGVASVGAASHYLGVLAATARRPDEAERHLKDAIALNGQTGGRPWLAQSQYELARLLLARRRTGDRKTASELLRTSLGIARDAGMRELQDRIEGIMRSHKRLEPERPDGLTHREQDVLRLIAQGRSTREISEELVLSARTSARHITNIYAKIGVRNRVEASAYALRHGLDH